MATVAEYHAAIEDTTRRVALQRVADLVRETVPDVVEGTSYAMPAFLYRGQGLLAAMATTEHLAIYPYSGSILPALAERLEAFSCTAGTLRFQPEAPPSDELIVDIVLRRRAQIDERLDARSERSRRR